jgi:hypothetical protein
MENSMLRAPALAVPLLVQKKDDHGRFRLKENPTGRALALAVPLPVQKKDDHV